MSKRVFITGASSGLGLSHAIYLTSKGYHVIGTSRRGKYLDLDQLKSTYLTDHTKYTYVNKSKNKVIGKKKLLPDKIFKNLDDFLSAISFVKMDVTDEKSVLHCIQAIETDGKIDVLINNAGSGYFGSVEELSIEQAKYQFEVNFFGLLRVLQAVIPSMRESMSGQIINTSSLAGIACIPFQAHYSATKAAILRLTESLRLELRPFNIHVSSLSPGDINTTFDANTTVLHNPDDTFKSVDILKMKGAIPLSQDSPYHSQGQVAWNTIIQNLIVSPPPLVVSKKIEKIIKSKKPKVHYRAGPRLQTMGVPLIKRLLPENLSTRIVAMFYGL